MISEQLRAEERATAIRALLHRPLLARDVAAEQFQLVAAHRDFLRDWFERTCGWQLTVDVPGGTARLYKRTDATDATRPATRPTDGQPLDRRRYALLMTVCAELVSRPLQAVTDLAEAVRVATGADEELETFDVDNRAHRFSLVDVLRFLEDLRLLDVTAGDVSRFGAEEGDAVVRANAIRLALLPASVTPPSQAVTHDHDTTLDALRAEPRYGDPDTATKQQADRRARHRLTRAVLDDPAVDLEDLHEHDRSYLGTLTGRQVVIDAAEYAELLLERHADVLVALDPTRQSTDQTFGDSAAHVHQAAGILLDHLRHLGGTADHDELIARIRALLDVDDGWAVKYQSDPAGMCDDAIDVLRAFALVDIDGGSVRARPAAARFDIAVTDRRTTPTDDTPTTCGDAQPTLDGADR